MVCDDQGNESYSEVINEEQGSSFAHLIVFLKMTMWGGTAKHRPSPDWGTSLSLLCPVPYAFGRHSKSTDHRLL
jgi:hypothetical protein